MKNKETLWWEVFVAVMCRQTYDPELTLAKVQVGRAIQIADHVIERLQARKDEGAIGGDVHSLSNIIGRVQS